MCVDGVLLDPTFEGGVVVTLGRGTEWTVAPVVKVGGDRSRGPFRV